jgi:sigma-B regulation protein RsbU (phosphoserine phosphatase)
VLRAGGDTELLNPTAMVLGAFTGPKFDEQTTQLGPGDRLVLFSDGFSEAEMNDENDGWPLDVIKELARGRLDGLAGLLASTAADLREQDDDITVMDIRVLTPEA